MKEVFKILTHIVVSTILGMGILLGCLLTVKYIPIALGLFFAFILGASILDSIKK